MKDDLNFGLDTRLLELVAQNLTPPSIKYAGPRAVWPRNASWILAGQMFVEPRGFSQVHIISVYQEKRDLLQPDRVNRIHADIFEVCKAGGMRCSDGQQIRHNISVAPNMFAVTRDILVSAAKDRRCG
jgi:hypothetical protein